MSFRAYLDTIKARTGKAPDDFAVLAAEKGLLGPELRAGPVVAWLKEEFGLGRGHAMAIFDTFKRESAAPTTTDERIDRHFQGKKARWRAVFDDLLATLRAAGHEATVSPTSGYLSLLGAGRKFAIVQVTADRVDIGIKLKTACAEGRLEEAGTWNSMVTHRVRITDPHQIDGELLTWLGAAYEAA